MKTLTFQFLLGAAVGFCVAGGMAWGAGVRNSEGNPEGTGGVPGLVPGVVSTDVSGVETESMAQASGIADMVVLGEADLADLAEIQRNQFRRMTPGDEPFVQDVGAKPAAWEEFLAAWDDAAAERDLATWVVPVVAAREGVATVLRDGEGVELWRERRISRRRSRRA